MEEYGAGFIGVTIDGRTYCNESEKTLGDLQLPADYHFKWNGFLFCNTSLQLRDAMKSKVRVCQDVNASMESVHYDERSLMQ